MSVFSSRLRSAGDAASAAGIVAVRVAGEREQAVELSEQEAQLVAALGALVFAGVRRELEGRLVECAAQLEQPHPVQTAEDRLDLTFPAHDLHLRHGDEHVLTPRSCRRPGG